jgi:hypothetical protein
MVSDPYAPPTSLTLQTIEVTSANAVALPSGFMAEDHMERRSISVDFDDRIGEGSRGRCNLLHRDGLGSLP